VRWVSLALCLFCGAGNLLGVSQGYTHEDSGIKNLTPILTLTPPPMHDLYFPRSPKSEPS